jgi:hypothetical protein
MGTAAIAAASIGQNEQLASTTVTGTTLMVPPTRDRMGGEGGSIVGDADEDRAAVGEPIIDAIRNGYANGIGAEVVIIHANRRAEPLDAIVFEVANQFALLGVNADNGKPLPLKAAAQR